MGTPIEGKITLTEKDLSSGLGEMSENRRVRLILPAVMGMVFLLLMMARRGGPGASVSSVILFVAIVAVTGRTTLMMPRRQARGLFAQMLESEREHRYAFDDEGVQIQNQTSTTTQTYLALHRFVEGPTTFLLYVGAPLPHFVPKRAFAESDLPAIRELGSKHVTPRKNPDKPGVKRVLTWVVLIVAFLALWQFLSIEDQPRP